MLVRRKLLIAVALAAAAVSVVASAATGHSSQESVSTSLLMRRAPGGRYQVAVQATSAVGTSSLSAPFTYHSHKRH